MDEKTYRLAKVVIAVIFLILVFLYVTNNRYQIGGGVIFDKWTESYYYPKYWTLKK